MDAPAHKVHYLIQVSRVGMHDEPVLVNAGDLQHPIAKDALIGQVVDGVDRGRLGKEGVISVDGLHPIGHDGRVPVVAMDDVRSPIHLLEHLDRGPTEKDEPFGIVGIHVDALTVVVLGAVHHIDGHVLADGALQDARRFGALVYRHRERC